MAAKRDIRGAKSIGPPHLQRRRWRGSRGHPRLIPDPAEEGMPRFRRCRRNWPKFRRWSDGRRTEKYCARPGWPWKGWNLVILAARISTPSRLTCNTDFMGRLVWMGGLVDFDTSMGSLPVTANGEFTGSTDRTFRLVGPGWIGAGLEGEAATQFALNTRSHPEIRDRAAKPWKAVETAFIPHAGPTIRRASFRLRRNPRQFAAITR